MRVTTAAADFSTIPSQPLLLLLSTPNEAAEVPLPSRVVDVKAKAFKGLAGSVLVLNFANVVGFFGLGEVPILRPKLHKEVKASSIGQRLAGRAVSSQYHGCKAVGTISSILDADGIGATP